jgi:hypothetical protein
MHWPTLNSRLDGAVIRDLRYDPERGVVVIRLEDGREVLVSACWEGCQVLVDELPIAGARAASAERC